LVRDEIAMTEPESWSGATTTISPEDAKIASASRSSSTLNVCQLSMDGDQVSVTRPFSVRVSISPIESVVQPRSFSLLLGIAGVVYAHG
jgi:hypothetical protein